jgi:delta24-sterol reductase
MNRSDQSFLQRFLTKHRGWVVLFTALPLSFLFEQYFGIRNWIFRKFMATNKLHDKRVKEVQDHVRRWNEDGRKALMCTARKPWLNMSTRTATFKDDCNKISVSKLRDILEVDTERMIVRAEPLVDMGYITRHLLPMGYALACQVEMEDLTVGGLCMGLGMETNSHVYGLIQETVESFEMVLADGSLVVAAKEENSDLYYALPWSWGTIGFLVSVELKIIPVKKYMHVRYLPCHSQEEYCRKMQEIAVAEDTPAYLEATIYARDKAVIMCADMTDVTTAEQRKKVNPINRWYKPWYYKHVEKTLEHGPMDEYIPLRHYYHRYTRSIFWELEDLIPFGNHPVYRYLFGWLGAPKVSFLKFTMNRGVREKLIFKHVVQDIIVPIARMREAVDLFHEEFDIYPLLVFPIRIYDHSDRIGTAQGMLRPPENLQPGKRWEMFFDLGAYGIPPAVKRGEDWNAYKAVRRMEKFTRDLKGYQCLYADTFMTKAEFREMFDHTLYDRVREQYGAVGAFPDIYEKIRPESGLIDEAALVEEEAAALAV